jgi:hypothetical protein
MSTLTSDQRWLLLHMGHTAVRRALLSPTATAWMMQSMLGCTGGTPLPGAPDWMRGWRTRGGIISAPWSDEPRVTVTANQINRFGANLSTVMRAELEAIDLAVSTENTRSAGWCHCAYKDQPASPHAQACERYHPTAEENEAHRQERRSIREWEADALRRALCPEAAQTQLDLFDLD